MEFRLVRKGVDFGRKRKKWVFLLAALGFSGYGAYRVYNSPSVARKRRRLFKLLGSLVSVVEALSSSVESLGVVSKDLKEFLQSDSDQLPNSLKQLSKIANSDEFSSSLTKLTQGLTLGLLRGYNQSQSSKKNEGGDEALVERVMEKVFSPAGSGFASTVVGSFARNLVLGICDSNSNSGELSPMWIDLVFSEKTRDLFGNCIQVFVTTAVAVYLDKTMDVNTYDELFSGLTNPRHEPKVKDMFVSLCNGAVETLVRTSHQVLTGPPGASVEAEADTSRDNKGIVIEESDRENDSDNDEDRGRGSGGGGNWMSQVSSTLAVPSNKRFVLDVTGRVTFEAVRSFLEFLVEKICETVKSSVKAVHESVVETGLYIVRYVAAKSSLVATICLSLCLHVTGSPFLLMPA